MSRYINTDGRLLDLSKPIVMGIVNITNDSFFEKSQCTSEKDIINRCLQIIEEGGRIIDIGAQSTSPTSTLISYQEEKKRLIPALEIIRREFPNTILSVDTFYGDIAKESVEKYGVNIINDISGGDIDKSMFDTISKLNVPYILTHMIGTPQNMKEKTEYRNLIQDLFFYFSDKIATLHLMGVNDIIIDPGFGFSKTLSQNYNILSLLKYFEIFNLPILVGISRKSMIYNFLGIDPNNSLNATTILNTLSLTYGCNILRVHDVKEAVECIKITSEINKYNR